MDSAVSPLTVADLWTAYRSLPRAEQVAFLATLIRRGELPWLRVVFKPTEPPPRHAA